jgi:hypothetical protein
VVKNYIIKFLIDFEFQIVQTMLPLINFIQQITPNPTRDILKIDLKTNNPVFQIGMTVFYEIENILYSGVIIKTNEKKKTFDVVLPNNLYDKNVLFSSVKYTTKPLFDFKSLSDVSKKNLHDTVQISGFYSHCNNNSDEYFGSSNSVIFREMQVYLCSTALLFRSLQFMLSDLTVHRFKNISEKKNVSQNLQLLAEQLAWFFFLLFFFFNLCYFIIITIIIIILITIYMLSNILYT